ncbi:FliH/SctL family protein [Angelakisella massiliensis]|uniref:FliH/SctL family protein n=1 Tax=Angelakisella massiliensis TaxID=1871018 RepID=UPI0008F9166A|nr:FliH/SctL family protein [Angelakisella massiliensis]
MPSIFKSFLKPAVNQFVFQDVDEIAVDTDDAAEGKDEQQDSAEQKQEQQPENGGSVVSFAKVQAQEIMEDAQRRAEELLEEYRRRGEEEAAQIREEAKADGYRQGYEEGLRKAQVEGQRNLEQQMHDQTEQVQQFLVKATEARDEMLQQYQDEMRDLSIAVAEKVIHISLKSSCAVIARMIQVATEKLKRRQWVHIYVGGYSAKELAQITPELMTSLAGLSEHIKIIPMPEDEAGTCIIEMPDEIIDASASTQLQNIRNILSEE